MKTRDTEEIYESLQSLEVKMTVLQTQVNYIMNALKDYEKKLESISDNEINNNNNTNVG